MLRSRLGRHGGRCVTVTTLESPPVGRCSFLPVQDVKEKSPRNQSARSAVRVECPQHTGLQRREPPPSHSYFHMEQNACGAGRRPHLSKMAPTPALWALFRWTCSPVARRIPSFTAMDRWEKEAMSSSFQPEGRRVHGHTALSPPRWGCC